MKYIKTVILSAVIAMPLVGMAEEEAASTNKLWKSNLSIGATYKNGNSEKSLFTLNLRADRFGEHNDIINTLYAEYGKTGTPTTPYEQTEGQIRGQSEYRHKLGDSKFFFGVFSEARNDAIKQIRIRVKVGPVIGYYFIDKENMKLDATFRVNYVYERTSTVERDYGEWRVAGNYLVDLSATAKFYLSAEYSANLEDSNDGNGLLVTGVKSQLKDNLSLFIELRDEYDNIPDSPTTEYNDVTILAGLSYDFM